MAESTTTTTTVAPTTTTTTTEAPSTTTTTTEKPSTTTTTTQSNTDRAKQEAKDNTDRAEILARGTEPLPPNDRPAANSPTLKEQKAEDRMSDARQLALDNHEAEHANDSESYEQTTSRDKV